MAAVSLSNFRKLYKHEGDIAEVILVSPSTMDSADTVDISDLIGDRTLLDAKAWDQTTGDDVTVTDSSNTLTVDASGGTTDHTYSIHLWMAS